MIYKYLITLPSGQTITISSKASYEEITESDVLAMNAVKTPRNPEVTKGWKIWMDEESVSAITQLFKNKQIDAVPWLLSDRQLRLLHILIIVQHDDDGRIPEFLIKFALLGWCYMLFAEGEEKDNALKELEATVLDCFSPEILCWEYEWLYLQSDLLAKEIAHRYKYKVKQVAVN